MRSRSNWNLKVLVFKEREKPEYPEKNLSEQRTKGENQQQTQLTYGVDARIRTRTTLVGSECEIRPLKRTGPDGGVKNTCSSSQIHFVLLLLLVDELPNECVEKNSRIFLKLLNLAIIRL